MKMKSKELEDIFLDEIIGRLEAIQTFKLQSDFNSGYHDVKNDAERYKRSVDIACDIILNYIEQAQHLVKQKDNYEQLLLDRMLADGVITVDVYDKYSPISIDGVELLLPKNN